MIAVKTLDETAMTAMTTMTDTPKIPEMPDMEMSPREELLYLFSQLTKPTVNIHDPSTELMELIASIWDKTRVKFREWVFNNTPLDFAKLPKTLLVANQLNGDFKKISILNGRICALENKPSLTSKEEKKLNGMKIGQKRTCERFAEKVDNKFLADAIKIDSFLDIWFNEPETPREEAENVSLYIDAVKNPKKDAKTASVETPFMGSHDLKKIAANVFKVFKLKHRVETNGSEVPWEIELYRIIKTILIGHPATLKGIDVDEPIKVGNFLDQMYNISIYDFFNELRSYGLFDPESGVKSYVEALAEEAEEAEAEEAEAAAAPSS